MTAAVTPPLLALADALTWRSAVTHVAWRTAYDDLLARRADQLFARDPDDACLAESLALLSPAARQRVLGTPAAAALLVGDFDGARFAQHLLDALSPGAAERCVPGTAIALDVASRFRFPDDELDAPETIAHPAGEREATETRLGDAVAALRDACPLAHALVGSAIRVLALRRTPGGAAAFYSSTFDDFPGLVRLTNAHAADADTPVLIDALVHEAIHCLLQLHEAIAGPFIPVAADRRIAVRSPWTGAMLRLQSYVHACAVWFGLAQLWSAIAPAPRIPGARIAELEARARSGFAGAPVSCGLAAISVELTPELRTFLEVLESRMAAAV